MQFRPNQGLTGCRRGVSSPVGFLLIIALVIASTTVIVVLGTGTITNVQDSLGSNQAETALTQLDSQAALVALGDSDSQEIQLQSGSSQQYQVNNSAGRMELYYQNQSTGIVTTVLDTQLGRVVYGDDDGGTVAYQGGGVWRSGRESGSVMVAPPEVHYQNGTLTLPLVTIANSGSVDGNTLLRRGDSTQYFPNQSMNGEFENPLMDGRAELRVTSQYYHAWGEYFEGRTDGRVEYDHANNQVTLELVTPLQDTAVNSATASLSAGGAFEINGGTNVLCGDSIYTNSYDSSGTTDDYCDQASAGTTGTDGDIIYGGDVDISEGSGGNDLRGDVVSGQTVTVGSGSGKPYVEGNISYTDQCNPSPSDCASRITDPDGSVSEIDGVQQASAINGIIETRAENARDTNDNGTTGEVSAGTLDYANSGTTDDVTLTNGTYYLTELTVGNGQTVNLDTTDGDVTIVVEENVYLDDNAKMEVIGDNVTNVYVVGSGSHTNDLYMGSSSEITNAGDDAPQFRLFGKDDFTARIGSGAGGNLARFVGVVFAPPGDTGTGSVTLDGGGVYGAILTGETEIAGGNGGSIHYDQALESQPILERDDYAVRVTYIHASVNEVEVSD